MQLSQKRLKELLEYNELTGEFTRLSSVCNQKAGCRAGWLDKCNGYRRITIDKKSYGEHRLAYLYMEGRFPIEIDHKNRIRDDNKWENLRESNRKHNNENRKDNNSFIGVMFHKPSNKWRAVTPRDGRAERSLGSYVTHLAACYARWIYDQKILCI